MHRTVVTLCGTSVLFNTAKGDRELFECLSRCSNKQGSELTSDEKARLDAHIEQVRQQLLEADLTKVQKLSAELNGLAELYDKNLSNGRYDLHFLLHSDTYIGQAAAGIVKGWLEEQRLNVQEPQVIQGMTTANSEEFRWGVSELARFCHDWIRPQQGSRHIVFNLSGGFKAMQGVMSTLGMLYADELIYIYERGELIRIPRLPISLDADRVVGDHLEAFRRMALGVVVSAREAAGIADSLLWPEDGGYTLSGWGDLVWLAAREKYYAERLLPPPIPQIQYGPKFEKSVANSGFTQRLAQINERIDDLARYIISGGRKYLNRLDLKPLKGDIKPPCTHEIDLFADLAAPRLFLEVKGDRYILHEVGKHL